MSNTERQKEYNREYARKWREKNKDRVKENNRRWRDKNPEYPKKWAEENQERVKQHSKKVREKNRERNRQYSREWRKKNPNYYRDWRKKNPDYYKAEKHREQSRLNMKKYRQSVNGKLKNTLNTLFNRYLKNKRKSCLSFLDYSIDELREHIESQFSEDMNWDNYGRLWSVDHIIPQNLYDFSKESEIKKCWNLRNLRPLSVSANSSKNDKLCVGLVEQKNIFDLLPIDILVTNNIEPELRDLVAEKIRRHE